MTNSADSKKRRIQAMPDGPYVVTDPPSLVNSKREVIETKPSTALCRCGRSENKPFCDGTHAKVGFSAARETDGSANKQDHYQAKGVSINDNRGVCAHAARCTEGLPSVFKYGHEPWIDPDGADIETIQKQIRQCPSGALSYTKDGVEHDTYFEQPEIMVTKNGPYRVVGGVELEDQVAGQTPQTKDHYTLCRCGGSKNKPFCDGTHWDGFVDEKN